MKRNLVLALSMLLVVLLSTPCLLGSARALENRNLLIAASDTESDYPSDEEYGDDTRDEVFEDDTRDEVSAHD